MYLAKWSFSSCSLSLSLVPGVLELSIDGGPARSPQVLQAHTLGTLLCRRTVEGPVAYTLPGGGEEATAGAGAQRAAQAVGAGGCGQAALAGALPTGSARVPNILW